MSQEYRDNFDQSFIGADGKFHSSVYQPAHAERLRAEAWSAPQQAPVEAQAAPPPPVAAPEMRRSVLDLGIFKIGVEHNSFVIGAGIPGVARADVSLGQHTGVHGEAGLGPIVGAEGGVGIRLDPHGIHPHAELGAQALQAVGADVHGRVDVGDRLGAGGHAHAYVGPAEAGVGTHANLGQHGLDVGARAGVGVAGAVGVDARARVGLNDHNSGVGASVGAHAGDGTLRAGAGVFSDRNTTVRPDVYVHGTNGASRGGVDLIPPAPPAPVETRELPPPPQPARGAEHGRLNDVNQVQAMLRQRIVDDTTYTVHPGQKSYLDVLSALRPDAERSQLTEEAGYLSRMNHNKHLKPGVKIATLTAQEIDWETRKATAKYFGWPPPQS